MLEQSAEGIDDVLTEGFIGDYSNIENEVEKEEEIQYNG